MRHEDGQTVMLGDMRNWLDEMIVDVVVAGDDRHRRIIANAHDAEAEGTGVIRVAAKSDLIWLKRKRNSKQDQADIERLENEAG